MKETKRLSSDIIKDMLSGDSHKIWMASSEICSLSQNHDRIMEFAPYKEEMYKATYNIDVPNIRSWQKVFEIIRVHEEGKECPCVLLGATSDPNDLLEDGYFEPIEIVRLGCFNLDTHYTIQCKHCKKVYRVGELFYHYVWWDWKVVEEGIDEK